MGAIVVLIVAVLLGIGYFVFVKKIEPIAPVDISSQGQPPSTTLPTQSAQKTEETPWLTYSDNSHISFQYPSDWKVGKFAHYPDSVNLQPSDTFVPEAGSNNISISVGGHCMNTQCLTVYSLDDMVKDIGATVISTAKAKNVTGYKVIFSDGRSGYVFIKGEDFVTIRTDIYQTYMDKIMPTLALLAKE